MKNRFKWRYTPSLINFIPRPQFLCNTTNFQNTLTKVCAYPLNLMKKTCYFS